MTEPMSVRSALCFPCDSEYCVFAQEGECRLPLVTGKLPVMTEKDGCLASIPKEDGWQNTAQKPVDQRVAYLFSCISKILESAPKESVIYGIGGTHIRCKSSCMADGLSFFFNMLAENQVIQTLGATAYLNPINANLLRRDVECEDPKEIWSELCYIAKAAKERYTDGAEAPVWSDGDMFFFKNIFANTIAKVADIGNFPEDVANAFADLMDAIGFTCTTGYYDPKDDAESGEVCETTGCYYVDL